MVSGIAMPIDEAMDINTVMATDRVIAISEAMAINTSNMWSHGYQ